MASQNTPDTSKAVIIGISGPSSSGKTTLARLLQRIFSGVPLSSATLHTFIIHEDDFYYPDDHYDPRIPYTTTPSGQTVQDWDTAAAIDTAFLAQALAYVRQHGTLPPRLQSKEDQNDATDSGVPDAVVADLREHVSRALAGLRHAHPDDCVSGRVFAVLCAGGGQPPAACAGADSAPAVFARGVFGCEGAKGGKKWGVERGQVDLEAEDDRPPQNFWVDPPGYVDDVVWPRYVEDHKWLLVTSGEGDLVTRVGEGLDVREDAGVKVAPGKGKGGMEVVLKWAVGEILSFIESGGSE
ncbi:hypothetical protein N7468_008571 [Penicillium chermesinum]|uniref:Phosphoribulokinase/uridine kinase domain-containing protein n=1 Tax=Penicillium chermesinum TaxID=63820 RepID=A0A9W9TIS4_9EURO|nr:uncharacterized protein N7468_008571 [Penicillium chermesinum]KAJ5224029.1 hypothetical protein N7468_008571 [Penicillium chermesinum]